MRSADPELTDRFPPTRQIALASITRNPDQARRHFEPDALHELADSLARIGFMQPVIVRPVDVHTFQLIAGERRWRAAQLAGLSSVPAIVRDDLDDTEAASFGLVENLQRESLGVMETARGLARLAKEFGLTHDAIAHRIGKSRVYVSNYLRLVNLAREVQCWLEDAHLSLGHAKILAGLPRSTQITLARRAIRNGWSVRGLEKNARKGHNHKSDASSSDTDAELRELARDLSAQLGNATNVTYQPQTGNGELRIQFHSLDEFEGLLERLGYQR